MILLGCFCLQLPPVLRKTPCGFRILIDVEDKTRRPLPKERLIYPLPSHISRKYYQTRSFAFGTKHNREFSLRLMTLHLETSRIIPVYPGGKREYHHHQYE